MGTYKIHNPKQIKKILLFTESFQSLTQRIFVELTERGYNVSVEFSVNDAILREAVKMFEPDLIIATYLKCAIPDDIFLNYLCLIIHPGIKGDRGPSSLDYAILNQEKTWGTTIIQADYGWDMGDIWSSYEFPMRFAKKSSIYRNEITEAAIKGIFDAIYKIENQMLPDELDYNNPNFRGCWNPYLKQEQRKINWESDTTDQVLRKIYASDGHPGVLDTMDNKHIYLYNAYKEEMLLKDFKNAKPGDWIAKRNHALLRKTIDGAIWITHIKEKKEHAIKLPSSYILPEIYETLPEIPISTTKCEYLTYQEIYYEIQGKVAYLYFDFYNGAMSTEQCNQLLTIYKELKTKDIDCIFLMGGEDFWSNGIHLNLIEHAESPAWESWRNINALDDLCEEIINDVDHLTIAVMRGNAGAGGVFFSLCCDFIFAKKGIILNPHYKSMGNLYGSELWTYLLPKRVNVENAKKLLENRLPISTRYAKEIGLIDEELEQENLKIQIEQRLKDLLEPRSFFYFIEKKRKIRQEDEKIKPLSEYRKEELNQMHKNFFGFDPSYHIARYYFVHKIRNFRTPLYLAKHRLHLLSSFV